MFSTADSHILFIFFAKITLLHIQCKDKTFFIIQKKGPLPTGNDPFLYL